VFGSGWKKMDRAGVKFLLKKSPPIQKTPALNIRRWI
jgi:hypothetical protein